MSIKGLTDRGLAFPEIGKIRKGGKKTDPTKPGPDLKYFRVEFDEAETKAAQKFNEVYADYNGQPTAIRIILPFNEIERMWDAWLEAYTAGRMVARSDGEIYLYRIDTKTGEIITKNGINVKTGQPDPYIEGQPVGTYTTSRGDVRPIFCKPTGRLKVILPELGRAAYMTVLTTSIHDIINISEQLRAFQTINSGRINGIPLILRRRPKEISTPGNNGQRARRVKYLLSIEADPDWVQKALGHLNHLALPGAGTEFKPAELPAPEMHDTEADPDEFEEGEYTDAEQPEEETVDNPPAMTYETAKTVVSPKGALLDTLTNEQLEYLASASTEEFRRTAAAVILQHRAANA